ncbi:PREDICTED: uncharacterized protein LOC105460376 [Wasmannia auropunctata]|uniref:uncharacterized protein LOC105460376 n=1 Tax=Wasmannia auropunctata TaxID=64793 RepID=UPI0005EDB658|nr:PREDICTED: uncharacterized protein LOC105460376 [Wasmannia auropunctata]
MFHLHYILIIKKYFVNQEKYFYLILLHMYIVYCVGVTILLATGTILITYLQHICGLFRIASYRMGHSVNILQNITLKNKVFMTENIISAIDMHRQAMKLCKQLESTFEIMIFCFTICVVACFSLNLYQVSFQFRIIPNV